MNKAYETGMRSLLEVVQQLSHVRTVEKIVEILRIAARDLTGADGATIVLRDGDRCHYVDENAIGPLWKNGKFPMSSCISGWVMLNHQSVSIPDITTDPRIPYHLYEPTFVRSLIMVPIRRNNPIGAIGNYWSRPRVPQPHEIEILQALADSASIAFENAQLYGNLQNSLNETQSALTALTARTMFFANISHEIRNPLQSVIGLSEVLSDSPTPEEQALCVSVIRNSGHHLMNLVNDFIDVAKIESGKFELQNTLYDPAELLNHMMDLMVFRAREQLVELVFIKSRTLPRLLNGDSMRIKQILINLMANAIKFARNGRVTLEAHWENEHIRFSVRDTGSGIPLEKQKYIFQDFHQLGTAESNAMGSGLGLSISKQLAELMGGRIWFESDEDKGTVFFVSLPSSTPQD